MSGYSGVLAVTLVTSPATSASLLWKDEVGSTSLLEWPKAPGNGASPFCFHQTAQKSPQNPTGPLEPPTPPQSGFERLKPTSATSGIKVLKQSRKMRVVGVLVF